MELRRTAAWIPTGKAKHQDMMVASTNSGSGIQKPVPDFSHHRLVVLERTQLTGGQIPHPVEVLQVERVVQVKRGADALDVFRFHARVGRVHQAGLAGCEVHDGVRDDRNKNQQNQPLADVAGDECHHVFDTLKVMSRSSFRLRLAVTRSNDPRWEKLPYANFGILGVMDIQQLSQYLDGLLDIHSIRDYPKALNGLQVENTGEIRKVGLAVDACRATIDMAEAAGCQMLFVHHGLFWGGLQPLRGPHFDKLSALIRANIALYSAHLPLDVHPMLGNNRTLADMIGLESLEAFAEYEGQCIGLKGRIARQLADKLAQTMQEQLGSPVKLIGGGEVETVGLVTGGAGDLLHQAIGAGLDCYITGEGASHLYHDATEGGCVLMLAGHYATETGGVKAVGRHLSEKFDMETVFLDYPTGL